MPEEKSYDSNKNYLQWILYLFLRITVVNSYKNRLMFKHKLTKLSNKHILKKTNTLLWSYIKEIMKQLSYFSSLFGHKKYCCAFKRNMYWERSETFIWIINIDIYCHRQNGQEWKKPKCFLTLLNVNSLLEMTFEISLLRHGDYTNMFLTDWFTIIYYSH